MVIGASVLSQGKGKQGLPPPFSNPGLIISDSVVGIKMAIEIAKLIRKYLEDLSQGKLKKPKRCELCKREGCLKWHGKYWRAVWTLYGKRGIPIKRLRCKECGGTFPLLPVFILKYRRYGADVIVLALEEKRKRTYEGVVSELSLKYDLVSLDVLTVWSWKKRISKATLRKLKRL